MSISKRIQRALAYLHLLQSAPWCRRKYRPASGVGSTLTGGTANRTGHIAMGVGSRQLSIWHFGGAHFVAKVVGERCGGATRRTYSHS